MNFRERVMAKILTFYLGGCARLYSLYLLCCGEKGRREEGKGSGLDFQVLLG